MKKIKSLVLAVTCVAASLIGIAATDIGVKPQGTVSASSSTNALANWPSSIGLGTPALLDVTNVTQIPLTGNGDLSLQFRGTLNGGGVGLGTVSNIVIRLYCDNSGSFGTTTNGLATYNAPALFSWTIPMQLATNWTVVTNFHRASLGMSTAGYKFAYIYDMQVNASSNSNPFLTNYSIIPNTR